MAAGSEDPPSTVEASTVPAVTVSEDTGFEVGVVHLLAVVPDVDKARTQPQVLSVPLFKLGQLLVWEWQSESYVLKQQGHYFDMNTLSYSADGQNVATGGDDGKVKVWNTTSGFCFVTFSDHTAAVSTVEFAKQGQVLFSASLDGTVRGYDLIRYRNFRTFTSPTPVQFSALAVDPSGEVVAAGSIDSFEVFMWSVQTGKLLDLLSLLAPRNILVSGSWDESVRLWSVFGRSRQVDPFMLGAEVLAVAFRPDGREIAVSTLNGQIAFWDTEKQKQTSLIEGRKDVSGGRKQEDRVTAANSASGKAFNSLAYTAEGSYLIGGGNSKYVVIYDVREGVMVKKFQISENLSLDGTEEYIDSRKVGDAEIDDRGDESELEDRLDTTLPGARNGDMSKRKYRPEARTTCVRFSPTGRTWAAVSTDGLLIYSLDEAITFDPFDLTVDLTPSSIIATLQRKEYLKALAMAFRLNEKPLIQRTYESVPSADITLLARELPVTYLSAMLKLVASHMESSVHMEFDLLWARALLLAHGRYLRERPTDFASVFRALQKGIRTSKLVSQRPPSFNQWTPGPYYASPAGPAFPGHGPAMAQPTGPMYETGTGISMYESQSLNQGLSGALEGAVVQHAELPSGVRTLIISNCSGKRAKLGIRAIREKQSNNLGKRCQFRKLKVAASVEDIPKRTNCRLARLPTDAKLGLLECMDAESILRLWGYDQSFRAVLSHPHSNGIWAYLQEASGLRPFTERRRATQQEIEIMKYTLFESCESCSARDAPRQWEWGSRYCHRCLPFKIISRGDFDRTYGPTFKSFPGAIGTITWMNPSRVAGLEGTKLSAEGLEVQDGYTQDKCYIALRQTVQSAVDAISKVVAQKPTSLKELQLQDIKGMIRGEQGRARDLYAARERQEQNIAEIERLGERRSRRVSPLIMGIRGLKLCENDIPSPAHPTWRHLVYRGEELTEVEWVGIKQRLIQLFKANRNMRLAPVLKAVKPPVPSSVAIPKYAYPGDITHLRPGNLPTNVFLNVCAYLDLPTVSTLEKASRDTSSVLRSKKANFVWGSIRRSMGLTMSFKDWPEREFLAYCLGRACSTCGKEGLNIPELVSTLCGNCFQSRQVTVLQVPTALGQTLV
ncbi:hypothetical protein FRB90_002308 [Tulasnella sp. 427]|nr:hypothetical protein FRB90_002308 [Tulasnella sp. 427]